MGERAELVERAFDVLAQLVHGARAALRVDLEQLLSERELDAQPDQPLLGAVVQIALDARPLVVSGSGDPAARDGERVQRLREPRLQPAVVDSGQHERADGVEQLGVVAQRGIMDSARARLDHR